MQMIFTGLIGSYVNYLYFKFHDDPCHRKGVAAIFPLYWGGVNRVRSMKNCAIVSDIQRGTLDIKSILSIPSYTYLVYLLYFDL